MIELYYIARRVDFKRRKGANLRFIFLLKSLLDHVPHYSKDIPTFLDWWLYMLSSHIMRVEYYFIIIRLRSIHYWISLSCEWETQRVLYMYRSKDSFSILHVKWIQEKIGPLRQTRIPCRWNSCRGPLIEETSFKFPIADLISRYLYKSYIISLIHIFVVQYEKTYSYTAKNFFFPLKGCLEVTYTLSEMKREKEREREKGELS